MQLALYLAGQNTANKTLKNCSFNNPHSQTIEKELCKFVSDMRIFDNILNLF